MAAVRYALRPTIEPTLRSMLRVSTTTISPTATTTTIETFWRMFCQFPTVRKCEARIEKKTIASPRAAAIPISRRRKVAAASSWADLRRGEPITPPPPTPAAAWITRSGVASARDSSATSRPSRITRIRSLMPRTSGSSEEMRRIVRPCVARCEIVRWTSAFVPTSTPWVGSSRSRIFGSAASHLPEHDLLLVAAREAADDLRGRRRLDPQLLHEAAGERALAPRPEDPARGQFGQDRHRDVRADGHRLHEPLMEPVLRQVGEPPAERRSRGARPERAAVDPELAALERIDPEDAARDLGATGAHEAGQADDLAATELERDVREDTAAGQAFRLEHDIADLGVLLREEGVERAAHHQADDLALRELGNRLGLDVPAVAEDGDDVGDRGDLFEAVADVDDGDSALAQPAHGREELLDLVRRERRSRLVHDQHAGARRERLGDLEQLAVGDAEPEHRRIRAELGPELVQDPHRLGAHRAPVDRVKRAARLPAGEHVLGHGQIGKDRRLLVHGDDPEPVRGLRVADPLRLAVDQEAALLRLDHAREDLHEGRLARAVLADERVDGRLLDREADVGDRLDAAVALRDPVELDQGAHRGYAAATPPSTLRMFPVDFSERGPAKYAIASATSSG